MPDRDANKARYFFAPTEYSEDKLLVADFVGEEKISQPYHFELTLVSEDPEVDFQKVVNNPATFTMVRRDESFPIHGVVANFEQRGHSADFYQYRTTLVPRLWQLSLTYQSRIFQSMTVEDIVRKVLKESGLTSQDFRFSLDSTYREREYCAQYQETDLNFVSRLLEHEGIQYFFEQKDGQEVVVFTDHAREHAEIEGESTVPYKEPGMSPEEPETVREFVYREQVVTGKVKVKDYNYEQPSTMEAESQMNDDMPGMHYEYGPHFNDQSEGERLAEVRNQEIECQRQAVDGNSVCLRFRAGQEFSLDRHYRDGLNQTYLLTKVRHVGSQRVGMGLPERTEDEIDYRNEFKCIPASVQYRPPRETPVPQVPGVMTAEVDGSGEYAYLDDQGRYRAEMHFDERNKSAGTASHPIRMKQPYTGKGEAGFHKPSHPGTEMVWACENGDPDRPMALGTAPNPNNETPVKNENNSQHIFRTTSENEFVIEDRQDQERIELYTPYSESIFQMGKSGQLIEGIGLSTKKTTEVHAEKGIVLKSGKGFQPKPSMLEKGVETKKMVLDSISAGVGETLDQGSLRKTAKKLKSVYKGVKSAVSEWAKGMEEPNMYLSSEGGIGMTTTKSMTVYTQEDTGLFADGSVYLVAEGGGLTFGAAEGGADTYVGTGGIGLRSVKDPVIVRSEMGGVKVVAGNVADPEGVGSKAVKLEAQKDVSSVSKSGNVNLTAESKDVDIQAKKGSASVDTQKEITLKAGSKITIKCGQSSITLKKSGKIEIKGMNIEVNGNQNVKLKGTNISSNAKVKNDVKGTMINSKAKGVNTVKGAMTKVG